MQLKVCGLKYKENIAGVLKNEPDLIGFIFYEESSRFIGKLDPHFVKAISSAKKVGVFVNAAYKLIIANAKKYSLDMVQLHGDESVEFAAQLQSQALDVIKVFRVSDKLPEDMELFASVATYFLFDTQTSQFGGSGRHFDWSILKDVSHPFFISGGIQLEDVAVLKNLQLKNLVGIDVNSRFETEPGMKDIIKIKELKELL